MDTELQEQLKALVDERGGLAAVLDALAMVCFEKAERMRLSQKDPKTSGVWEDAAGRITKLASKLDI